MVVGRGDRHHLREAEARDDLRRDAGEGRRVADGTGADDDPLPRHEARGRHRGADGAGVGEAGRRPLELVDGEAPLTAPVDQVVVGRHERGEVERPAFLMLGTRRTRSPFFSTSIARPRLISFRGIRYGCPPTPTKASFMPGCFSRARTMAQAMTWVKQIFGPAASLVLVHQAAVLLEGLDRNRPERGRGRHLDARRHVLGDLPGDAAERDGAVRRAAAGGLARGAPPAPEGARRRARPVARRESAPRDGRSSGGPGCRSGCSPRRTRARPRSPRRGSRGTARRARVRIGVVAERFGEGVEDGVVHSDLPLPRPLPPEPGGASAPARCGPAGEPIILPRLRVRSAGGGRPRCDDGPPGS